MRCVTRNERCVGYRDENDLLFENETEKIVKRNQAAVQLADAARLTWASTPSSASRSSASSHRGRTRSLSPSRYTTSPSTTSSHYLDSEGLPWTAERSAGPGLKDRGIATDVAVAHFFDRYVLYPCNDASTPGFLEHLPCLFKEVNVEGRQALRWAVKATALADLSRLEESTPEAAGAAFDCYGEALTALRESLSEKGKVPDDYDLMTVVVLDIFEVRSSDSINSFLLLHGTNHTFFLKTLFMPDYVDDQSHAQGMAHILRLRGHGQFHDARSWGLFRLAHHRVVSRHAGCTNDV